MAAMRSLGVLQQGRVVLCLYLPWSSLPTAVWRLVLIMGLGPSPTSYAHDSPSAMGILWLQVWIQKSDSCEFRVISQLKDPFQVQVPESTASAV
jgi:hypothetical protein